MSTFASHLLPLFESLLILPIFLASPSGGIMKSTFMLLLSLILVFGLSAQTPYKLPPKEVVQMVDAPPTPFVSVSPTREALLVVDFQPYPSISVVSRPILRIAGIRITPSTSTRQHLTQYTGFTVQNLATLKKISVKTPKGGAFGFPLWSFDGSSIAFTRDTQNGMELWVAATATGEARNIKGIRLHDVIASPFEWMSDNRGLLVWTIPGKRGKAPQSPAVPAGPNTDETYGKLSTTPTYQDLLRTPYDEDLFEYYATAQLAIVDTKTGSTKKIGKPGLYTEASFSPNEQYLLVTRLERPFSYRVPYSRFTRTNEVWDKNGASVRVIAKFPVTDDVPTQGVPTGPRSITWYPLAHSMLLWVEALDDGNPTKKVPHRDRIMTATVPGRAAAVELLKLQHRYQGFTFLQEKDQVFISEYDRDRRWRTTSLISLTNSDQRTVLFDLSANDAYNDPGRPLYKTDSKGISVVEQEGDWIYLTGQGASKTGNRPFLRKFNVRTKETQEVFRCNETSYELFISFAGKGTDNILTRLETQKSPPNYYVTTLGTGKRTALTDFKDPAPQMTGMKKQLLSYTRADGVPLSGTLYLPPDYREGTRLPCLIWAYPLEYSDPATAGQVRTSPHSFTFFRGASPLFFVAQGYAVLMDATMPVVGDPETMNNTFVEQIVSSAKAAIDTLDAMGVVDRKKVVVSGHSYGAFMTANLLAHCDLFAAGIARSGAYNRSLTPFGFQSERRSFWEATDTYMRVSPFTYANKINEPILLIHGEADNNTGTFPIQTERLFQAIRGNGGTARLVMLPYESHGYSARESILHVLAESLEWADRFTKGKDEAGMK